MHLLKMHIAHRFQHFFIKVEISCLNSNMVMASYNYKKSIELEEEKLGVRLVPFLILSKAPQSTHHTKDIYFISIKFLAIQ